MERSRSFCSFFIALVISMLGVSLQASATTVTFEGFPDSTPITNQFAGLIFSNSTIFTAGFSLNEFEFPPRSGVNVVFDDGGAITIIFGNTVQNISAFLTYVVPVTLTAFDSANNSVGSDISNFTSNLGQSGDPGSAANELFSINFPAGIRRVTIEGDPLGSSFVLDDLAFAPVSSSGIPEPNAAFLLIVGAIAQVVGRRWRF